MAHVATMPARFYGWLADQIKPRGDEHSRYRDRRDYLNDLCEIAEPGQRVLVVCDECWGEGRFPAGQCLECSGHGVLTATVEECGRCGGSGEEEILGPDRIGRFRTKIRFMPCEACNATGRVVEEDRWNA